MVTAELPEKGQRSASAGADAAMHIRMSARVLPGLEPAPTEGLSAKRSESTDDHCGSCNNTGTGYTLLKRPAGAGTESSAMHKHTCERTCTEAGYRPDNCGLVCEPLEAISSHHLVTSSTATLHV